MSQTPVTYVAETAEEIQAQEEEMRREQDLLDARLGHIPLPAGATTDGWLSVRHDDGDAIRCLEWSRHDTGMAAGVSVDGWQDEHGRVDRHIGLYDVPDEMTADDARRLAATLIEAANALDALQRDVR